MSLLVTGSSGHLGEALMRTLRASGRAAVGLDVIPGPFTDEVASIADRDQVARVIKGVDAVLHAATLHKPHVATHAREAFVETNVLGTLTLLEEASRVRVRAFVMTSTTSAFGDALKPPPDAPAAWIDERVAPSPKNIYGVTKTAAEDLCQLFHRNEGLAVIVLRTSRFFPEEDDDPAMRAAYPDDNSKANEYLFRRVAIEDVVDAHLLAAERAPGIGFGKYIVSATTPFRPADCARLRADAPAVVSLRVGDGRRNTRGAAGACFPASTASMTMRSRAATSAGGRSGISPPLSRACGRPATSVGRSRGRSAPRATMANSSKARPIRLWEAERRSRAGATKFLPQSMRSIIILI